MVAYLSSPLADFITGANFRVDGGLMPTHELSQQGSGYPRSPHWCRLVSTSRTREVIRDRMVGRALLAPNNSTRRVYQNSRVSRAQGAVPR